MFRQGQLAVHGLAILYGRNEAGISNRGKFFLHHAVCLVRNDGYKFLITPYNQEIYIAVQWSTFAWPLATVNVQKHVGYGMSWKIWDQIYDFWPADLIEFCWLEIVKWLSKDYGNWFPCTKQGHAIIITDKY